MKVVILGAGGILGQHMIKEYEKGPYTPGLFPVFYRKVPDNIYKGVELYSDISTWQMLEEEQPNVVLNLAGENRVDYVEENPSVYHKINVTVPRLLATWCTKNNAKMIQVSTQGVFSGEDAPYSSDSKPDPITHYGRQKAKAELLVQEANPDAIIARMTFVLGVRPFRFGRENPLEQMFRQQHQLQVNDRWFSPAFAPDAARQLWKLVMDDYGPIVHIGEPVRVCRYDVAYAAYTQMYAPSQQGHKLRAVSHDFFHGIAPRPKDTTWAQGSMYDTKFYDNIKQAYEEWKNREWAYKSEPTK